MRESIIYIISTVYLLLQSEILYVKKKENDQKKMIIRISFFIILLVINKHINQNMNRLNRKNETTNNENNHLDLDQSKWTNNNIIINLNYSIINDYNNNLPEKANSRTSIFCTRLGHQYIDTDWTMCNNCLTI